jgi:phosphate ABC transporter phosphate-binding protein
MTKIFLRRQGPEFLAIRWLIAFLLAANAVAVSAQKIDSLPQVKTLYVAAFTGGPEAAHLHQSFVRRLAKGRFQLVQSPKSADAIVTGTEQIWVRGYVTINPRTPSTDRQAVYAGYLSLEVAGADGRPLWSWLVTPGRLTWSNIVDDLAAHAASKLLDAAEAAPAPSTANTPSSGTLAQTNLVASGATFPAPLYRKWFEDFEQLHPGVHVRYTPEGSQAGNEKLVAGKIDFAGSDVAPEVVLGASAASHLRRIASVLGAVVPIYNLSGVARDLRFTPQALADIYLGRVRRWNDDAIRRFNKDVDLPDEAIAVIHRSEGSGTTWVWSDFLSSVSSWSSSVGRGTTLHWPVGTGAEGNDGIAEAVRHTPNSIGYVELTYAIQHRLSYGMVRNRAGEFVRADLDSVSEAARSAGSGGGGVSGEPAMAITNAPGKYAYPITAFTWFVFPADIPDSPQRAAMTELFRWILTTGQRECSSLGYSPLPREIADEQLQRLNALH